MLVHDEYGREIGRFPIDWDCERILLDYGSVKIACPLPPFKAPPSSASISAASSTSLPRRCTPAT